MVSAVKKILRLGVFLGLLIGFSSVSFADTLSLSQSSVLPKDQVVNMVTDSAFLTVKLVSEQGQPVSGHLVRLISSTGDENIAVIGGTNVTNSDGEISFRIVSASAGVSTYTVYDVTADRLLDGRARVVFFDSEDMVLGDSVLPAASEGASDDKFVYFGSGADAGSLDGFAFSDIPDSVTVGDNVTFKLSAVDALGQTITGYQGHVQFSVESGDAFSVMLPNDYSFVADDLGAHTFSLAISFLKAGQYRVVATDSSNDEVVGWYDFDVSAEAGSGNESSSSGLIVLNSLPSTSSNNILVISGSAPAAAKLRIFDNESKMKDFTADNEGLFSYTTPQLEDGDHEFYVAQVNDIGTIVASTTPVSVTIDTGVPGVTGFDIVPNPATPGSNATVTVTSDKNLSSVTVVLNDNIFSMTKAADGNFTVSVPVPNQPGDYIVSLMMTDYLGNQETIDDAGTLAVSAGSGAGSGVPDVTGLVATPKDHRVTLTWDSVSSSSEIKNYRIYYGLAPDRLVDGAVDTFTNSNTWYIPNLVNGTDYYFAVVAVDDSGNTSEHFSNIAAAAPYAATVDVVPPDVANGDAGGEVYEDAQTDVSDTGPSLLWLVVLSLVSGAFYVLMPRVNADSGNL